MRNLNIYLSALISLHGSLALHHGPSHFRDLQAFPKYEVQFLNHLPIAESDAKECLSGGIEREEEWMGARAPMLGHRESDRDSDRGRRRLSDGAEIVPVDVSYLMYRIPSAYAEAEKLQADKYEGPVGPCENGSGSSRVGYGAVVFVSHASS